MNDTIAACWKRCLLFLRLLLEGDGVERLGGSAFELGVHGGDVVVEDEKLKGAAVGGVGGV